MGRIKGLLIFTSIYILAYVAGYFSAFYIENIVLRLLVFDCVCTVVTYIGSCILHNASVYDAYWSLTPAVMLVYLMIYYWPSLNVYHFIFIVCFMIWSFRLTINWVITFKDMKWMDWRYKMYRDNHPKLYPLINFFGIEMMPTVLVFVAFIPAIVFMKNTANVFSLIGCLVLLVGVFLEFIADHLMHSHLDGPNSKNVCDLGLWNYTRHPNYLGEILTWLGVFICLFSSRMDLWYLGIGFVAIVCLFEFISIPMMERRQLERREGYKEYQKTTSRLIPLPKRK